MSDTLTAPTAGGGSVASAAADSGAADAVDAHPPPDASVAPDAADAPAPPDASAAVDAADAPAPPDASVAVDAPPASVAVGAPSGTSDSSAAQPSLAPEVTGATPAVTSSAAPAGPASTDGQSPEDHAALRMSLLKSMLLQRRFEERCAEAYALGKIGGFCHLYIGQEAISAGTMSLLRPDDYVVTSYRDHGQALARGISPRVVMAELFGRKDGCSGGKGGSMHMFDRSLNFLGGHGIVGGHIPLAAGVGWAIKYRGGDQICVCFFGEAAVNIGAFHEALNIASLWTLPVVFLIENNRYGMGTEISRATANEDVTVRAAAYRMKGESVDAQDVFAVRDAVGRAIDLARREKQPTLLEMRTYRFMGHSMSDAASGTYRTREELDENMKRDPVLLLREKMHSEGELPEGELAEIDDEAKAIAQDAWDFADKSPEPPLTDLYENVLVESTS